MKTHKTTDEYGTTRYTNEEGQLHREDRPALIYENGDEIWYLNGKRHRKGAPALIHVKGDKFWYQDDKLHREDGPAIERLDGSKEWFLKGVQLVKEDYKLYAKSPNVVW